MMFSLAPERQWRLLTVLTVFAAFAVAAMLCGWLLGNNPFARWSINTASTLYVFIALAAGAHKNLYGRLVLAAVCLCWLGDMLGPGNFLLGAAMFLLAHLFLIPAFLLAGWKKSTLIIGALAYLTLSGLSASLVLPKMASDQLLILVPYLVVITAMGACSVGVLGTRATPIIPVAALLFYISDFFLAQTAFLNGGPFFKYAGYPMYYAAVILFALSPAFQALRGKTPANNDTVTL